MHLSDGDIKKGMELGNITIQPFNDKLLQAASYDVRLGSKFMTFNPLITGDVDPFDLPPDLYIEEEIQPNGFFRLLPGGFALGVTLERLGVSASHIMYLHGKSSMARLAVEVHATAGLVDPGNTLRITFEFLNNAPFPILLRPGMSVGQVTFHELSSPAERPYGTPGRGSKYFCSDTVEGSKYSQNVMPEAVPLPLVMEK